MAGFDQYKSIIFDWDGTLVDTCGLILKAHNHVRHYYNKPLWTMDDFLGTASKSAREYYPDVYGDKAQEAQVILYDFVEAHHIDHLAPMEGALELCQILKRPIGIVSNKRHKTLLKEVNHLGWADHFSCIVGAGQADKDKPSPDPLLMGMKMIEADLKPSDILYVGDTETDLLCAKNTGCDVVFIQSEGPRPDLIEKYRPQYNFMSTNAFYSFALSQIGSKTEQISKKNA